MTKPRAFILRPNRSFTWSATAILFTLLGLWVVAVGIFTFAHKTWPILGFAGLELLGLILAFALHSHKSRIYEEVVMTPQTLTWTRHLPSGKLQSWQAPLCWTQISTQADVRSASPLRFAYAGQTLDFGHFLSAEDRVSFAREFKKAQRSLQTQNI